MTLQDDHLQAHQRKNLALSAKGPLAGLRLTHCGDAADSWIDYDAIDAWLVAEPLCLLHTQPRGC